MLIVFVLWHRKKAEDAMPPEASVETNTVRPIVAIASNAPVQTNVGTVQNASVTKPSTVNQQQSPLPEGKVAMLKEILQANDADIVFYGRLADQFGSAISGAEISFNIQYRNPDARGIRRGQVVSDVNGFFTISGYKGADLGILPKKAGYTLNDTNTYFRYSQVTPGYFVPDSGNPTVINMWKMQGGEPLVGINKTFKLPYTNAPIFFDLVTGNVVPSGGDCEVIITRAPGLISGRNRGDWSIKLIPVNGGIMESDYQTAQMTFAAPAEGYQDAFFVQMSHDDPGWFDNIQRSFFMSSRSGQVYSKFAFNFEINDDPNGTMWFQFKGVANANSSRSWETPNK
jgi:hypothetical protein